MLANENLKKDANANHLLSRKCNPFILGAKVVHCVETMEGGNKGNHSNAVTLNRDGGMQVWCMAISSRGDFVVTGSHDRSLRLWERTEEQTYVEELREEERTKRNLEALEQSGQQHGACAAPSPNRQ